MKKNRQQQKNKIKNNKQTTTKRETGTHCDCVVCARIEGAGRGVDGELPDRLCAGAKGLRDDGGHDEREKVARVVHFAALATQPAVIPLPRGTRVVVEGGGEKGLRSVHGMQVM